MVISKSTAVVHPRPCIKEAIIPLSHGILSNTGSSTLPRVRAMSRRVAELPSLRYGTVGAGCIVSGPLRVSRQNQTQPQHKYIRNFTTGIIGDDVPIIRGNHQTRRVRFDLPPSPTDVSPTDTIPNSASPSPLQARNTTSRSRQSTFAKYRINHLAHEEPVRAVTVVSSTTSVRERAHPVAAYVRGTLSPTAPVPVAAGSALLRAARDSDEELLRELLRAACVKPIPLNEVNAVDGTGRTALSYVASNGSVDILESILQLPGTDPNLPDNEGNTPLHFAAQAGQVECLNFLLSRTQGLEIDARNHLGFTPLMKAALQGRNKCAKLLLFAGANPTLRDTGRGLRAEQWARFCGRYVCADVIEKFARHRLLERSTSCGRWGSDSDIVGTRLLLGKVVPVPPQIANNSNNNQPHGIKSKLRKVFRTSSGPSNSPDSSSSARLITQLTSAALCASSPVLPASPTVPPVVKSLIRPLTVPRLQITLANGAATVTNELGSLNVLLEQNSSPTSIEKPPRIKKKMK